MFTTFLILLFIVFFFSLLNNIKNIIYGLKNYCSASFIFTVYLENCSLTKNRALNSRVDFSCTCCFNQKNYSLGSVFVNINECGVSLTVFITNRIKTIETATASTGNVSGIADISYSSNDSISETNFKAFYFSKNKFLTNFFKFSFVFILLSTRN